MLSASASCSGRDCLYEPAEEASVIPHVWVLWILRGSLDRRNGKSEHNCVCVCVCVCVLSFVFLWRLFQDWHQKRPLIQQNLLLASTFQETVQLFHSVQWNLWLFPLFLKLCSLLFNVFLENGARRQGLITTVIKSYRHHTACTKKSCGCYPGVCEAAQLFNTFQMWTSSN